MQILLNGLYQSITIVYRRDARFQLLTAELRSFNVSLRHIEDENRDRQRAAEFGLNSI